MRTTITVAALAFALTLPHARAADGVAEDSIYQLSQTFVDQDGKKVSLDHYQGAPTIITMFFGTCPGACPLLISDIRKIEAALDPKVRGKVRVLLVSFDPDRDTPDLLTRLAASHRLDLSRWKLATASDPDARELAAVLGVKFRKLSDGNFNHNSVITVLDGGGSPKWRLEGVVRDTAEPVKVLSGLVSGR